MADYHPLIARAVEGLANNTAEARRTLYERARAALVAQLRGIDPPLSEAEITRERLALEDSIRKVEAEAVRKARSEPRPAAPRSIQATSRPYGGTASSASPGAAGSGAAGSGAAGWRARSIAPSNATESSGAETRFAETAQKEAPSTVRANEPVSSEPLVESRASARSRLLNARTTQRPREEFKGFRNAGSATDDLDAAANRGKTLFRNAQNAYGAASTHEFSDAEAVAPDGTERFDNEQSSDLVEDVVPSLHGLEQGYDLDDQEQLELNRHQPQRSIEPAEHYRKPRPPRSYRGPAKLAAVLVIVAGLGAMVSWQWSNISGLYQFLTHMRSKPTQTAQPPTGEPKFAGRVPQDQTRQPPTTATPKDQSGPALAQRVVLYEEDAANPQGKQYIGSAVWRTETVSPGSGLAPELQIRADVTIPERNMTLTWSLRRNTDQALPASHTIEIMFNLPADFAGGGIANVPGVLMKESEQARGVPLAGLAVKVTNGFFLIGLSAVDADVQRNLQLLKDRSWFDIPIVYNNGGRAILALEKGPPGNRAFGDAFAAWGK
jgi:hypothetical protein